MKLAMKVILFKSGITPKNRVKISSLKELIEKTHPIRTPQGLVRIGGTGDGSYLIPNDLIGSMYCFSPGVSDTSNFESDLSKLGIKSFLADNSVDAPPIAHRDFDFIKKHLGIIDNDQFITLKSWISSKVGTNNDLILQMDIEGAEYNCLENEKIETLSQFRIMVIEFHNLENLFYAERFEVIAPIFEKILTMFHVVHIHPNNSSTLFTRDNISIPSAMEFTFLRKDRVKEITFRRKFPHRLDTANVPRRKDKALPRIWYATEE